MRLRAKSAHVAAVSSSTPRPVESVDLPSLRALRSAGSSDISGSRSRTRIPKSRISSSLILRSLYQLRISRGAAFFVCVSWLAKTIWLWTQPLLLSVCVATVNGTPVPCVSRIASSEPAALARATSAGLSLSSSSLAHDWI